ncbi:6-O-methylguanine DNA methyltransferase [Multifurca ochricompacta]|uniref:Methylated-DNA--protein-cysteine methyltransferase n=1 Tax=Multifurca ochricompacta TaxID=376703 RepID=A0AAD4M4S7_9AGAM|nr:6-O-methylguanine DNA methyltransferase [Multifurca ochricompacta]
MRHHQYTRNMPAEREHQHHLTISLDSYRYNPLKPTRSTTTATTTTGAAPPPVSNTTTTSKDIVDFSKCDVYYPMTRSEREGFRTKAGKRVPPHHWAVYDLIREIPAGKVSTYKDVCVALGEGSPRSIGGALRNNPFAPLIPCHRVIASSLFVGGFKGEWASSSSSSSSSLKSISIRTASGGADEAVEMVEGKKTNWHEPFKGGGMGPLQNEKLRMLAHEGVDFGKDGKRLVSRDAVWMFDA